MDLISKRLWFPSLDFLLFFLLPLPCKPKHQFKALIWFCAAGDVKARNFTVVCYYSVSCSECFKRVRIVRSFSVSKDAKSVPIICVLAWGGCKSHGRDKPVVSREVLISCVWKFSDLFSLFIYLYHCVYTFKQKAFSCLDRYLWPFCSPEYGIWVGTRYIHPLLKQVWGVHGIYLMHQTSFSHLSRLWPEKSVTLCGTLMRLLARCPQRREGPGFWPILRLRPFCVEVQGVPRLSLAGIDSSHPATR